MIDIAEKQVVEFERAMQKVLSRYFSEIITANRTGMIWTSTSADQIKYANDILPELENALKKSGYYGAVRDIIEKNQDLLKHMAKQRALRKLPTTFTKQTASAINGLAQMEFAQFEYLGSQVVNQAYNLLLRHVNLGLTERAYIQKLRDKLEPAFKRYAKTVALTTRTQFQQKAEKLAAEETPADERYWEYTGPADDNLRSACANGLATQYFTNEEMEAFEAETADEREYNCRHIFVQISAEQFNDKPIKERDYALIKKTED